MSDSQTGFIWVHGDPIPPKWVWRSVPLGEVWRSWSSRSPKKKAFSSLRPRRGVLFAASTFWLRFLLRLEHRSLRFGANVFVSLQSPAIGREDMAVPFQHFGITSGPGCFHVCSPVSPGGFPKERWPPRHRSMLRGSSCAGRPESAAFLQLWTHGDTHWFACYCLNVYLCHTMKLFLDGRPVGRAFFALFQRSWHPGWGCDRMEEISPVSTPWSGLSLHQDTSGVGCVNTVLERDRWYLLVSIGPHDLNQAEMPRSIHQLLVSVRLLGYTLTWLITIFVLRISLGMSRHHFLEWARPCSDYCLTGTQQVDQSGSIIIRSPLNMHCFRIPYSLFCSYHGCNVRLFDTICGASSASNDSFRQGLGRSNYTTWSSTEHRNDP